MQNKTPDWLSETQVPQIQKTPASCHTTFFCWCAHQKRPAPPALSRQPKVLLTCHYVIGLSQSPSHDFFRFWCAQCEGLFIPAARQIYEWSFALGAWYAGRTIRCSSLKCMSIKRDRANCRLFGILRRDVRKSSWSKFVESASCITVLLFMKDRIL